jgi:cytochrome c peroxidase
MNIKRRVVWYYLVSIAALLFSFTACQKNMETGLLIENDQFISTPTGFPPMEFPSDNAFSQARWELGKKLFFDPIMSIDSSISCASCHKPHLAFSDDVALSSGVFNRAGTRNAPSLGNVGYQPYFIREGSVPTLEMQVLVPIQEHNEFNHNIVDLSEQLANIPAYSQLSIEAYSRSIDPFVITRALGNFERSLISGNSAYDKYINGNQNALNAQEKKGLELFFSAKTNCTSCHSGFNFTDYTFQNNGLYENYKDRGRMRFTNDSADLALFKVPTLRNVELSKPYMFNGQFNSLKEVLEHYNSGGANHPNKSPQIIPLNLSATELADLEAFLNSLSDYEFINNPLWN